MQRFIQLCLVTVMVMSLPVLSAVVYNDGLVESSAATGKRQTTEAERLARGILPNPPAARYTPSVLRARDASSAAAPRNDIPLPFDPTAATPCNARGIIVFNDNEPSLRLVGQKTPGSMWLGVVHDPLDAIIVTFDSCSTDLQNLQCLNCAGYPGAYLANLIITGPADLTAQSNSTGYLYLTTAETPFGPASPSLIPSETAVWAFDSATLALTLNWVNSNNVIVNTSVSLDSDNEAFQVVYSPVATSEFLLFALP